MSVLLGDLIKTDELASTYPVLSQVSNALLTIVYAINDNVI